MLGWRERIWHLYWYLGPGYRRNNHFGAHTELPDWWRKLNPTDIRAECLRDTLTGLRDRGYAHHIQRLMVLGNHALHRGYDPAESFGLPSRRQVRTARCSPSVVSG